MEINAYNSSQVNNSNSINDIKAKSDKEALDMQDFLNLLVAEMTNQDAMNPMDNTEFIAQMAQFSSLQAMNDLTEMSMQGQATSLIGKNVVVAKYNAQGQLEVQEGLVQRVTIHSGETKLYVNDLEYDYSNVMEVKQIEQPEIDPLQEVLGKILEQVSGMNDSLKSNKLTDSVPFTEEIK
ncbi:MAG: flagellar hook assembly protein FlgD [Sedimentibacter sp.]